MSNVKDGLSTEMLGIRQDGPAQESKLAKLNYQELLETRVMESGGVRHPIEFASVFDRDDNQRVATSDKSFELSTEECVDIQDRLTAVSTPVGASKDPIKVQGKEYSLKSVDADSLEATAVRYPFFSRGHSSRQYRLTHKGLARQDGTTIIASLSATLLLVIQTKSDQTDAIRSIARSFTYVACYLPPSDLLTRTIYSEGVSSQAV
ncbi:Hypothetical predicted protein [Olea europaea subsp. europaea]|uniref:Uncharacterized protein n=1 Tax=Olea europaea subsp. europaea TaxID=158383 RepID=A0A8S0VGW3_OLEEU|nr:Hypothetical predicted protein [Olea europaea subsp. europaea]